MCKITSIRFLLAMIIAIVCFLGMQMVFSQEKPEEPEKAKVVNLPKPEVKGKISLEEAIKKRRCVRSYKDKALSLKQLSQLLWSADGITGARGYQRAAPSAGGLQGNSDNRHQSLKSVLNKMRVRFLRSDGWLQSWPYRPRSGRRLCPRIHPDTRSQVQGLPVPAV